MAITQLKSGSYRVEVYCPKKFRKDFRLTGQRFRETRSSIEEAKELERKFEWYIDSAKFGDFTSFEKNSKPEETNKEILFKDFYEDIWLNEYKNGRTAKASNKVPTQITVKQTKNIFKCKILPAFGDYSISYLNDNKQLVVKILNEIAESYANIKTIKSYFNQIFDLAEFEEIIEVNKIEKSLRRVTDVRKQEIISKKNRVNQALTVSELRSWLQAFETELDNGSVIFMDYLLFHLTLKTGIRKSEAYAFQWKHVNFKKKIIYLEQSLAKDGTVKSTKSNKKSEIMLSDELKTLLEQWQEKQTNELINMGIKPDTEQFIFTYTDNKGNINSNVHIDYLNYRLNTMKRKYPNLAKLNPHKLRHTFATLAREGGADMDVIRNTLGHSDRETTRIYVNREVYRVDLTAHDSFSKVIREAKS